MGDILIKGMEMPKSRGEYVFLLYVDSDGTATVEGAHSILKGEPFEAVPIPPHGRLIDADALMKLEVIPSDNWVFRAVEKASTIVPAEEGET